MFDSIIVWTIIVVCAFFIGRKYWRQWRAALSKNGAISCGCGCSCGEESFCPSKSLGPGDDNERRRERQPEKEAGNRTSSGT